jgi:hypothetical protein
VIPVHLAVEDSLSEAVLRKLLSVSGRQYCVGACYGEGGFGYIKRIIRGLNKAAKGTPFIVLTDLDNATCPLELIISWLPEAKHHNLLLRIAVKEVEAWLIGDRISLAQFFRIRRELIPNNPETIIDPKLTLISLAKKSPIRKIREDIAPVDGSTSKQGPNYNGCLITYVEQRWDPSVARLTVTSLDRTLIRLSNFSPLWEFTSA